MSSQRDPPQTGVRGEHDLGPHDGDGRRRAACDRGIDLRRVALDGMLLLGRASHPRKLWHHEPIAGKD